MSKFHTGQTVLIIENYDDEGTFSIRRMKIKLLNNQQAVCESVVGTDRKIVMAYEFDDVMYAASELITDADILAKATERAAEFIADRLAANEKTAANSGNSKVVIHALERVNHFKNVAKPMAVWI